MKRSLSKTERLKKSEDIRRVLGSPQKQSCLGAKLAARSNSLDKLKPGSVRFGVGLSKKFGNAVERNRAKRQVREIFRLHKHRLRPGLDLVFLVFPGAFDYHDRERQFLELAQKAGILVLVPGPVPPVAD